MLIKFLDGSEKEIKTLRGADLRGANLCVADLRGANLCGANLCGANLCRANLCRANLCEADLCGADLCGANLCGADLRGANICNADLLGADLLGANICNADLRGADLRGADLPSLYYSISLIGSRKGMTTYSVAEDKIYCGCYTGTLKEFKERVAQTYPEKSSVHRKEYDAAIFFFESLAFVLSNN
jgi:hypothetical protein